MTTTCRECGRELSLAEWIALLKACRDCADKLETKTAAISASRRICGRVVGKVVQFT